MCKKELQGRSAQRWSIRNPNLHREQLHLRTVLLATAKLRGDFFLQEYVTNPLEAVEKVPTLFFFFQI